MMALTKSRIWFAVFMLIVFLIGLGTGMAIDRYAASGRRAARGFGGMGSGPRPAVVAERMSRELDLSDTQQQQLEEVFERGAGRFERFRRENRQRFVALSQQLSAEVEAILTPEQREQFRELRRSRQRRGGERPPRSRR